MLSLRNRSCAYAIIKLRFYLHLNIGKKEAPANPYDFFFQNEVYILMHIFPHTCISWAKMQRPAFSPSPLYSVNIWILHCRDTLVLHSLKTWAYLYEPHNATCAYSTFPYWTHFQHVCIYIPIYMTIARTMIFIAAIKFLKNPIELNDIRFIWIIFKGRIYLLHVHDNALVI